MTPQEQADFIKTYEEIRQLMQDNDAEHAERMRGMRLENDVAFDERIRNMRAETELLSRKKDTHGWSLFFAGLATAATLVAATLGLVLLWFRLYGAEQVAAIAN